MYTVCHSTTTLTMRPRAPNELPGLRAATRRWSSPARSRASISNVAARTKSSPWVDDGPLGPGRLPPDDPHVLTLVEDVAGDAPVTDLGGTMSLNLHLASGGLVLRVHQPFVTRHRILALREVRRNLGMQGLCVPEPRSFGRRDLLRCRGRWGEIEAYVAHTKPPPTWGSYVSMYRAMGRLHRALVGVTSSVPRPVLSTYATPRTLRRWAAITSDLVTPNTEAAETVVRLRKAVRVLERQWIPALALPVQVIHGDIRLATWLLLQTETPSTSTSDLLPRGRAFTTSRTPCPG